MATTGKVYSDIDEILVGVFEKSDTDKSLGEESNDSNLSDNNWEYEEEEIKTPGASKNLKKRQCSRTTTK